MGPSKFIAGDAPIPYAVFFENKPEATAAAQEVVITDQLDTQTLDLATFSLGAITFGSTVVNPPPGRSEYHAEVDLRPAQNLIARIDAELDKTNGLLTWRFGSLDPDTLQPTLDPIAGLLPPNSTPGDGEGSVLFTVKPKTTLSSGAVIGNGARIVFDTNAPIDTPIWINTIDNSKPASQVSPLGPTQTSNTFTVAWSGTDIGSGIANYSIFVSEDGAPFTEWLHNTTATFAAFFGAQGKTYRFFSTARDLTGNVEAIKATAEATTTVTSDSESPVTQFTLSSAPSALGWHNSNVTLTLAATDNGSGVQEISYAVTAGGAMTGGSFTSSGGAILLTAEGDNRVRYFSRDVAGNIEAAHTVVVRIDKSAPTIADNADRNVAATSAAGASVVFATPLAADSAGPTTVTCSATSGQTFPIGQTAVVCTATDGAGNQAQSSFIVNVVCCSVTAAVSPAAARRGQVVWINGSVRNPSTAPQQVAVTAELTTPRRAAIGSLPLALPGRTNVSFKVPFWIPSSLPPGVYTLRLQTTTAGGVIETTTTLTVQ